MVPARIASLLMVNDFEVDGPIFKIPLIHLGLGNYLKVAGAMTE